VFTARCALSPYINQTCLVFKELTFFNEQNVLFWIKGGKPLDPVLGQTVPVNVHVLFSLRCTSILP
jgi:hypothetical protein